LFLKGIFLALFWGLSLVALQQ
jgi:hypothetical protein